MASQILPFKLTGCSIETVWDIYKDGKYVATELSEDAAASSLQQLERCNWSYLDLLHSGRAPLELVAKVKADGGWISYQIGRFPSGKVLFKGRCSDGNTFSYQLFNQQLRETIQAALPGTPRQGAGLTKPAPPAPLQVASHPAANDGSGGMRAAAAAQDGPATARVPAKPKAGAGKRSASVEPAQMSMF